MERDVDIEITEPGVTHHDDKPNDDGENPAIATEAQVSRKKDKSCTGTDSVCINPNCDKIADSRMIACKKCDKFTHYSCTQLPPYQIAMYMTKGYRRYICESCFIDDNGEVHSDYFSTDEKDETFTQETQTGSAWKAWEYIRDENKEYEQTVNDLNLKMKQTDGELISSKNELKRQYDECRNQKERIESLTKENEQLENRLRIQGHMISQQRKNSVDENMQVSEIQKLRSELESMQNLLNEKTAEALKIDEENKSLQNKIIQVSAENSKLKDSAKKLEKPSSKEDQSHTDVESRLNQRLDKIEHTLDQLVTKKLGDSLKEVTQIGAKIDEVITSNKTFAECAGANVTNSLTAAFRASKNTEKVHDLERERRSANLIIYGVNETTDGNQNEHDQNFVVSLLETIGVTQRPKKIMRLGNKTADKSRPVKLVMENEGDKNTIMARLGNLKNAEEIYRKVSIRDDYTIEERDMIREFVKKAEAKNLEENTQEWKVRGTPKTGLRLVRITKRQ